MSLQTCVEKLFALNSNYFHPDQAFNQAASLQTLSNDLYTDPCRFVYELIQNADDASSTHLQIALIDSNYLIVSHNGKTFDEKDVRSLCAVNNSTKTRSSQTAGYKGLGFKAIFGKSDYVLINTKEESFGFDANYDFAWTWNDIDKKSWELENQQKFIYPWQICPIWTKTQCIPPAVNTWLSKSQVKMPVNIIIRLHNMNETRDALQELAHQPYTFLFLQHIRRFEFLGIPTPSTVTIEPNQDGSISLSSGKKQRSQWLLNRREIVIPPEILQDRRLPEKLRQMLSTELGLAAKIDAQNPKRFVPVSTTNGDSVLFAYMPTKISAYNLPLLINANFLTNANREQIHTDSVWNQWLFERLPVEIIEWIDELTKRAHWGDASYDLLPISIRGNDTLAEKYNHGCSIAFANTKFIHNTYGENLSICDAIIDSTQLSNQEFIGNEPVRTFILHEYKSPPKSLPLHPFVPDNSRLRDLFVRRFEWENAIDMFCSEKFQRNFSIDRDIRLISYLFDKSADQEISRLIHRIPFLMDRNKRLQSPTNIFFPSQFNDPNWNSPDCKEAYVHDDLMKKLPLHHREWLEKLGVVVKTDLTFFYCTIIPQAPTFIRCDNALSIIQRLFYLYINAQIIPDHLKRLEELSLLTNANTLVPANCLYLSFVYQPRLPLDIELPTMSELFVSPSYMNNSFHEGWKYFFLLLGVHESIDLILLNNNGRIFHHYHEDQIRIIFNINSQQINKYKHRMTIQFLELTEKNFSFACFFWQHVMRTINIDWLNEPEVAYWGAQGKPGATLGSIVNTFPQWFVRTKSCIPVRLLSKDGTNETKCLKGPEVFTSGLSALTGRYLPTFECAPNTPPMNEKWLKFFRFKTELSVEDHLYLLEQVSIRNQAELDANDDTRIQNIYASLLEILSKIDLQQRTSYREKCQSKNIRFLSERNVFMPPEELAVCSIDTIELSLEYHVLKSIPNNRGHKNLSNLLYVLNIEKIDQKDLNLKPMNANLCNELENRLQRSFFLSLFDYHKIKKRDQLNQLENINYYEADRLELYTNNQNIFVGTTTVYDHNHCLYVTKPWNSPSIVDWLARKMCELLKLRTDLFLRHINIFLTTSSIENYFIQLGVRPADNGSSSDQLSNSIAGENVQSLEPLSELLLAGLEKQHPHWTGCIYHYTHLENAVSILHDQALKSRCLAQENHFKDSSAFDFMSQTNDQVNHYVRFYFRPRTLTQRYNENLGNEKNKKRDTHTPICPVPIFFSINLRAVLSVPNLRWKTSIGDMSTNSTEYDCTSDIIQRFDFSDPETEPEKCSAQLEFLIEDQLNFGDLPEDAITLIYQNSDAKESLEYILEESRRNFSSKIAPKHYFGENNRIHINHHHAQDHISIRIDGKIRRSGEMFLVQIKSDNIDIACKGNIHAVFHHNQITTIYGVEKPLDIFIAKRNYSVYYKYEERYWLIYTNHNRPNLDLSHLENHPEFQP